MQTTELLLQQVDLFFIFIRDHISLCESWKKHPGKLLPGKKVTGNRFPNACFWQFSVCRIVWWALGIFWCVRGRRVGSIDKNWKIVQLPLVNFLVIPLTENPFSETVLPKTIFPGTLFPGTFFHGDFFFQGTFFHGTFFPAIFFRVPLYTWWSVQTNFFIIILVLLLFFSNPSFACFHDYNSFFSASFPVFPIFSWRTPFESFDRSHCICTRSQGICMERIFERNSL